MPPAGPAEGWGPPPPPPQQPGREPPPPTRPSPGGPWWRRWYVVLAAALVALGLVALGDNDASNTASRSTAAPTSVASLPTVATTLPTTASSPPTTIAKVTVPKLVGMKLADAKDTLAERELEATVGYKATARYRTGTVISQSRQAGASVLPGSRISLVVAKAPPPPSTAPPATTTPSRNCARPTRTPALTLMPWTTTAQAAPGTDPSTWRARSGCSRPTRSTWTGTATAGAARTDEHAPEETGDPFLVASCLHSCGRIARSRQARVGGNEWGSALASRSSWRRACA